MNISEDYKRRFLELSGLILENRIEKLRKEKYSEDIINFALEFSKLTARDPSKEDNILRNQYIPWIASQAKLNPEITSEKEKLDTIILWIKNSGYQAIKTTEGFESVYEKAKDWLNLNNINSKTGERIDGGKVVTKYPNGYVWIQATEVNWCINAGEKNGWCFNQLNRAEQFVGLGDIGINNRGYFLLNAENKPIIALQYNSRAGEVEDIQGTHNTPLSAELLPYAFDIFKTFTTITNVKGHGGSFWKSFETIGTEELKREFLNLPNLKLSIAVKLEQHLPLTQDEIVGLNVRTKLKYKFLLNPSEISILSLGEKIQYDYITHEELDALPVHLKVEHEVALNEEDLKKVRQPIINKIAKIIRKKADPRDLFVKENFEGFNDFVVDEYGIKLDITYDEYLNKYSGVEESDQYYIGFTANDEEVDSYELEYMHSYLDENNTNKIKYLAKILGVDHKYDFEHEGDIQTFIDENLQNSEDIFMTYQVDLSMVYGEAKEKSIQKVLEKEQKFKYVNGYLVLPWRRLYKFIKGHPITELRELENAELNGEINLESAYSDYYGETDEDLIKDLNDSVGKKLDNSLEIIEENPQYAENVSDFQELMKTLKFEKDKYHVYAPHHYGEAIYKLELPKKTIYVQDVDYEERKISIFIIEFKDKAKKTIKRKMRGEVSYESIVNYAQQYSLFEEIHIRKMVREILSEDFRYMYDRNSFVPPSEVASTANKALAAIAANKQVDSSGTAEGSGAQKAKSLSAREPMNHAQLKRMKSFFDNNEAQFKNELTSGKNIQNSGIIQSWNLWGGDAGKRWVERQLASVQSTNQTSKKIRSPEDGIRTKTLMDPHNTRIHR